MWCSSPMQGGMERLNLARVNDHAPPLPRWNGSAVGVVHGTESGAVCLPTPGASLMRRMSWMSAVVVTAGVTAACSHSTDVGASNADSKLPEPVLPAASYVYADAEVALPPH